MRVLLSFLILAVILPFTPLMPGGKPLIKVSDLKWPELGIPGSNSKTFVTSDKTQTVYKWKDAQGNIHFSDTAPDKKEQQHSNAKY